MNTKNEALTKLREELKVAEETKRLLAPIQEASKRMQHEGSEKAAVAAAQVATLLEATKASVSARRREAQQCARGQWR